MAHELRLARVVVQAQLLLGRARRLARLVLGHVVRERRHTSPGLALVLRAGRLAGSRWHLIGVARD